MSFDKHLIIYHGDCKDGFCAAWVASKIFPGAEFHAATYKELPPNVVGKVVYILDFSYSKDVMVAIAKDADAVFVLDHHKTAENNLKDLPDNVRVVFDMNRSGAGLAWDVLVNGGDKDPARPWLVDYVEDRDLWRFKLPHSKIINAYISALPYNFEAWDAAHSITNLLEVINLGKAVQMKLDEYCDSCIHANLRYALIDVPGFPQAGIPIINAPHVNVSELLDKIIQAGSDTAMAWRMNRDGKFVFSVRGYGSRKIAEHFGGGGHDSAAGFEVATLGKVIKDWV